ncbi:Hypothetical protein NTJ_15878 [Nesidiocoris tenuis]|uniref:Reverse transcriptase domain-containing protein n=1 Tax=Nesidiocoris tenuis TaxID=355587 RepID=A0ABN7BFA7_9HEMI|nr:Hypothetical protein NTJ_15878 [Nesidiocoris tenuis]
MLHRLINARIKPALGGHSCGVPKGSHIGPLLFTVVVDSDVQWFDDIRDSVCRRLQGFLDGGVHSGFSEDPEAGLPVYSKAFIPQNPSKCSIVKSILIRILARALKTLP